MLHAWFSVESGGADQLHLKASEEEVTGEEAWLSDASVSQLAVAAVSGKEAWSGARQGQLSRSPVNKSIGLVEGI